MDLEKDATIPTALVGMRQGVILMTPIILLLQGIKQMITPMTPTTLMVHTTKLSNPTAQITQALGVGIESCKLTLWTPSRKTITLNTTKLTILHIHSTIQMMKVTTLTQTQATNPTPTTQTLKTTKILKNIQMMTRTIPRHPRI